MTTAHRLDRLAKVRDLRVAVARRKLAEARDRERQLEHAADRAEADAKLQAEKARTFLHDALGARGDGFSPVALIRTLAIGFEDATTNAALFAHRADRRRLGADDARDRRTDLGREFARQEQARDAFDTFVETRARRSAAAAERRAEDESAELARGRGRHGLR